jgi:hypothetical protein
MERDYRNLSALYSRATVSHPPAIFRSRIAELQSLATEPHSVPELTNCKASLNLFQTSDWASQLR